MTILTSAPRRFLRSARDATREQPRWRGDDREFLPAALEILETPPSPVRMWLLRLLCLFVAVTIAWMFIGKLDVIAVAQGKIQPAGRVKTVEPLETGKVRDIGVSNGTRVTEGQLLVQLDDTEARAEDESLTEALAGYRVESLRRKAAIEAALSNDHDAPPVDWPSDVPADILTREQRVLASDVRQLKATLANSAAQHDQREAERARLLSTIASQEELLKIEEERVQLRSTLEAQKLGSKLNLFDALETLQNQKTTLAQQKGQLAETLAALRVIDTERAKTVSGFVAENSQKLADVERQLGETRQKLAKARAKLAHMQLVAPASGTVQALSITTVGQVVMPGEEVMRIVPDRAEFEVECYMPNKDIAFVRVGQDAIVKLEAFPFTRYGSLPGRVASISKEAIPDADAQQREANSARGSRSTLAAGAQRVQNLVFPVTLSLEKQAFSTDGADIPISNGMAATVEIRTGQRRIINYILSPFVEVASQAMKER